MPQQGPSWDLVADIQLLLQFHFMQNAFIAGTLVALLAGAAGYFVVLRGQSFAAHMLSQVGFPGAAAGVLLHVSPVLGLIVFCLAAALGIGWAGRDLDAGHRAESAAVGSILAFSLGLGLLFFRLYAGSAAPTGQPPLTSLSASNFNELRGAFNAAQDSVRVVTLLSPT